MKIKFYYSALAVISAMIIKTEDNVNIFDI